MAQSNLMPVGPPARGCQTSRSPPVLAAPLIATAPLPVDPMVWFNAVSALPTGTTSALGDRPRKARCRLARGGRWARTCHQRCWELRDNRVSHAGDDFTELAVGATGDRGVRLPVREVESQAAGAVQDQGECVAGSRFASIDTSAAEVAVTGGAAGVGVRNLPTQDPIATAPLPPIIMMAATIAMMTSPIVGANCRLEPQTASMPKSAATTVYKALASIVTMLADAK